MRHGQRTDRMWGFLMLSLAMRNNVPIKLPVLFFTLVVLAGIRPGYAEGQNIKQIREAAIQGDTTAQFNLGNMYYKGEGVPKDNREAVKWYRKAAEQVTGRGSIQPGCHPLAPLALGVPKDNREAVKWYEWPASRDMQWLNCLGKSCTKMAYSCRRTNREAVKWYRKAAEQGHAMPEPRRHVRNLG